jgi:predicted nucleic acid-binding protein
MVAPLHASEMTRLEVFAGMRTCEQGGTLALLSIFFWHPINTLISERAGELGRRWLPSHRSIDSAHLAIATTVIVTGCELLTCNVKYFPMFKELRKPY